MIAKLKQLFSLEIYSNEDARRLARILLTLILAALLVSLVLMVIYAGSQPALAAQLLMFGVLQLLPLVFLFRGRLLIACYIAVLFFIGLVTLFSTQGQGIHDYTLIVFPAIILFAGLSGSRRLGIIATLLMLLACAWLVFGEAKGWFVIAKIPVADWVDFVNISLLLLLSALAVHLLSSNLENGLMQARRELAERQRAEQKLLESESQNRALLNSVPDILFRLDRQGVFLEHRVNDTSMLYLPVESFINKRVDEVLPPQVGRQAMQVIEEVFRTGEMKSFDYDMEFNGEMLHFENRIVPLMADQVLSVVRDITGRRRAEIALRESEELYHAMFEKTTATKLLVDPGSGAIMRANQAAAEFYGYTLERLEGMNINQINTLPEELLNNKLQESNQGKGTHFNFKHRLASGEIRDVEVYTAPIEMNGRRLLNSIIHDVTERNQAQAGLVQAHAQLEKRVEERTAELHAANLALEQALHTRDQFLAAVSHELRTPLIGILSLSQALQLQLRPQLNEKQMLGLQTIEQSGQRLHELINHVLDFSRLQSGEMELQVAPFGLNRICKLALQSIRESSQKKQQELVYSISPETIQLKGDERRIKEVLANLLGNAVKFTQEEGRIELAVAGLPAQKQVRLQVTDNGIGIQPEQLAQLFQPFTQLDARLGREYNGTGLGLALAQRLVALHGGRVEVESVFGKGSTFSVYLPWEPDED